MDMYVQICRYVLNPHTIAPIQLSVLSVFSCNSVHVQYFVEIMKTVNSDTLNT